MASFAGDGKAELAAKRPALAQAKLQFTKQVPTSNESKQKSKAGLPSMAEAAASRQAGIAQIRGDWKSKAKAPKSTAQKKKAKTPETACGSGLWAEAHGPQEETDLAVHAKKLKDIKQWFETCASSRSKHWGVAGQAEMLVLSGPPGCCKTAVVRVLANQMGIEMVSHFP